MMRRIVHCIGVGAWATLGWRRWLGVGVVGRLLMIIGMVAVGMWRMAVAPPRGMVARHDVVGGGGMAPVEVGGVPGRGGRSGGGCNGTPLLLLLLLLMRLGAMLAVGRRRRLLLGASGSRMRLVLLLARMHLANTWLLLLLLVRMLLAARRLPSASGRDLRLRLRPRDLGRGRRRLCPHCRRRRRRRAVVAATAARSIIAAALLRRHGGDNIGKRGDLPVLSAHAVDGDVSCLKTLSGAMLTVVTVVRIKNDGR
mmetsp:Transcript_44648/g.95024  ORF Transcript_44648/g.95024 Transcript_44648/m.95024 type:complete len:254 (+) Transcript_44648:1784-2545(+)